MNLFGTYRQDAKTSVWRRESAHEFAYTDGDAIEQRIKRIIDECQDPGIFSHELESAITDWPSLYHLGRGRLNLLWPFKPRLSGDILEIGCGCGAITRALGELGGNVLAIEGSSTRAEIAASRCRGLPNVRIVNESFDAFEPGQRFDVVTLIGVLEYARKYFKPGNGGDAVQEMLARARSFLRPGGVLLLAIENQLGLKYLAGSPEDHNGMPMYGVEDLYGAGDAVTFGEDELRRMLGKAGLGEQQWWYPYPDYKFPVSMLSEQGVHSRAGDLSPLLQNSVLTDPQRAPTSFSLENAWPPVLRNGLAGALANSFAVLASDQPHEPHEQKILAYHFASGRREEFAKQVAFCENAAGEIIVKHQALFATSGSVTQGDLGIEFAETAFIAGRHWQSELIHILAKPGWTLTALQDWAECWFSNFLSHAQLRDRGALEKSTSLEGRHFDAVPRNLIVGSDGAGEFFDQEWLPAAPCPLGFLLFRSLGLSFFGLTSVATPCAGVSTSIPELFLALAAHVGIAVDAEDFADFVQRENQLQARVTNKPSAHLTLALFQNSKLEVRQQFWHPDHISRLESAVLHKDRDLAQLGDEVHRLEAIVLDKDQGLAHLGTEANRLESVIQSKDQQLQHLGQEVQRLEVHANTKQAEIQAVAQHLQETEAAVRELQQRALQQAAAIEALDADHAARESQLQIQKNALQTQVDGLSADLDRERQGFETERHYYYAEVAKRDNELANAAAQIVQLHTDLLAVSGNLQTLRQTRWLRLREALLYQPFGLPKLASITRIVAGGLLPRTLRARTLAVGAPPASTEDSGAYRVKLPAVPGPAAPRVVHVIANFMTGGSSRLVVDLVEFLGDRYHHHVLTSFNPAPPAYIGLDIEECRQRESATPFVEYYQRMQPDMVHVHYWGDCDEPWYALAIEAAGSLGLPVIENINTPIAPFRSPAVAKYVYVSDYVRSVFGESDTRHVTVYPGSDFNLFTRAANEHAPEDCVGMVYRLEHDKLNEAAIEPFIRIAQLRPRTRILIVGGGSLLDPFKAAVAAAGVSHNFEFTGYVSYDALPALYRRMSLFVAPVWKESFGQVSPFAMSMKVPVIGYDVGAIPEIIGTHDLVAPAADADALARIAVRLLDTPKERKALGIAQLRRAQENFSVQAMIDHYAEIYAEITSQISKESV
jgi:glycosyltransferase involved in cell wall biosynthesis/SAM-dependent methyltransferase